jgi:hypothetical protein
LIGLTRIGPNDDENQDDSRGYRSSNQQFARTTHLLQKLLRFQQVLTAVRTTSQMIFYAVALRGCQSAIEISRNVNVCYVTATFVR